MSLQARILSENDVANRLGHSRAWFYANRKRLEQLGLPKKDQALKGRDSLAVEAWLDRRSGIVSQSSVEQILLERIHGQTHA